MLNRYAAIRARRIPIAKAPMIPPASAPEEIDELPLEE